MSEAKKALIEEPFNFADLFCQMGDPVVVVKKEETKNKIIESLEEIEKKLNNPYDEIEIIDNSDKEQSTNALAQKIGYKTDWSDIDFTGWQDIKSDRINIENALKKLDEQEN